MNEIENRGLQVNAIADNSNLTGILMELQRGISSVEKSVSEFRGEMSHLREDMGRALQIAPEVDALRDRVLVIETAQKENERRWARFWTVLATLGTVLAGVLVFVLWTFDHFRLK